MHRSIGRTLARGLLLVLPVAWSCPSVAADIVVTSGTLAVNSAADLGGNNVIVDNGLDLGATLQVNATANLTNGIALENGGTLDNSGSILRSGALVRGISGGTGTVINQAGGSIVSTDATGVLFFAGGSVTNTGSGSSISGGFRGVGIQGAAGTVTNTGGATITAVDIGIYFDQGGTVTNGAGSIIRGSTGLYGNWLDGFTPAEAVILTNSGTITGISGHAVDLENGGTVNNQAGGVMSGTAEGLLIWGGVVTNTGAGSKIAGNGGAGVDLADATTLTNQDDATIQGSDSGVSIFALSTVTNQSGASIIGVNNGVWVQADGTTVTNQSGATITGQTLTGVLFIGATGSVTNDGAASRIQGNFRGIEMGVGGTVTNTNGAQIVGSEIAVMLGDTATVTNGAGSSISGSTGIYGYNGPTVTNSGTITGTGVNGIEANTTGSITNQDGGTITGLVAGVYIHTTGTLTNTGAGSTITGTNQSGVDMGGAVTLTNEAGASIGGGTNGVTMRAGGTVTNQSGAAIQGDTDGVLMQDGGSVTNRSGATIAGATRGVESFGGTILNTGSGSSITSDITGLQTFAGGGSITNADGATIRGGQNGVLMDSSTALTNQSGGQIVGAADMGVQSFNGGSVTNTDDGTLIQGAVYGIDLQGGTGTVTNRGGASIKGGSVGLFMDSGGTLTNSGNGSTISGQDNGVYITGGTGSVTNENGATVGSAGSTGVWLDATDGTVTNTGAGSTISGDYGVLFTGTAGTVNNQDGASITGSTVGVYLDGGGSVINGAGSTLSGTAYGLYVGSGETTLSNAGTIAGDVRLADNRTNRVTLTTGGRIIGELYIGTESTSTLTLDGTGSQVYSQAVTGGTTFVGGVLTKQGSGTWIIDVAADAGLGFEPSGTVIDAGVLQIGSGGTAGSISGDITNNATLAFDRSNASTYSGAISGPGNVLKAGAGTLTLTASSTYTGDTTVEAGRLAVNGSIAGSAVTVLNGATLGGTGAVGPVTVQTGGTIGAGNSIGTLTVAGNYTQAAGSFLQAEFNAAGQADRINVNGTVTLSGGTVQALPAPGSYARTTTYTILNATGGVVGTFAGVTSSSAAVRPTLTYDGNNVFLTLLRTVSSFSTAAQTPNQQAVGATLDRANATAAGDFGSVLDALWLLDPTQTGTALNAISGQNYAGFTNLEVLRAQIFMTNFAQQAGSGSAGGQRVALAEACDVACDTAQEARWGAWAGGLGGAGTVAGNANSSGLAYSLGGVAFGIDHRFDRHLIVGLTSGYTAAGLSTETMPGRGSSDTTHVGLYARWTENVFYLDGLAGYARSDNHMQRTILMPGLQPRTAHSHTHSDQFFGQLESGYKVELGGVVEASLTPFGRLQASTSTIAAFTEWGADSLDLDVAAQNVSSLRTIAGAQIAGKLDLGSGSKVNAALRLGWSHEFADVARPVTASFAGAPVDPVHDTRCRGTARWRDRRPGARHRHG